MAGVQESETPCENISRSELGTYVIMPRDMLFIITPAGGTPWRYRSCGRKCCAARVSLALVKASTRQEISSHTAARLRQKETPRGSSAISGAIRQRARSVRRRRKPVRGRGGCEQEFGREGGFVRRGARAVYGAAGQGRGVRRDGGADGPAALDEDVPFTDTSGGAGECAGRVG